MSQNYTRGIKEPAGTYIYENRIAWLAHNTRFYPELIKLHQLTKTELVKVNFSKKNSISKYLNKLVKEVNDYRKLSLISLDIYLRESLSSYVKYAVKDYDATIDFFEVGEILKKHFIPLTIDTTIKKKKTKRKKKIDNKRTKN